MKGAPHKGSALGGTIGTRKTSAQDVRTITVIEIFLETGSPQREDKERVGQGKGRESVCRVSFGTDTLQCKRKESSRQHSRPLRKEGKLRGKYGKHCSITEIRDGGSTAIESTMSVMQKANPAPCS